MLIILARAMPIIFGTVVASTRPRSSAVVPEPNRECSAEVILSSANVPIMRTEMAPPYNGEHASQT